MAISLPRILRSLAGLMLVSSCPSKRMEPDTRETLRRQQAHHGQRGHGLSRTALADQPERLSPLQAEAGVLHDGQPPAAGQELHPRCSTVSSGGAGVCVRQGERAAVAAGRGESGRSGDQAAFTSRRPAGLLPAGRSRPRESRRPSATRLKARTVSMMARPGKIRAHGEELMNWKPSLKHAAPTRRRWLLAHAEEAQARLGQQGEAQRQRELNDDGRGHVGQHVASDQPLRGRPEAASGLDVVPPRGRRSPRPGADGRSPV